MATPAIPTTPGESLNVVALISGGKDSFFSLLHCRANGHRVVALANLHPATASTSGCQDDAQEEEEEEDLNSFMYQTVGHEVVPLYADATGISLYRQEIRGGAGPSGKDYASGGGEDETESMVPLLRRVMAAHPEVNALCAGAILSTYQRTRVESVAVRLGLTPLAFLWKYPVLPLPLPLTGAAGGGDDSQLLADMAAAGLEARIVKVASGGLDEAFLWENVASPRGVDRLLRAMRRFGGAAPGSGAVIGEGGEFETLVVDGPPSLFRKRIVVDADDRRVVREGGGTAWLSVRRARLEDKDVARQSAHAPPRIPDLLDARFRDVLQGLDGEDHPGNVDSTLSPSSQPPLEACRSHSPSMLRQWCVVGDVQSPPSIEAETTSLVEKVKARLHDASLPPTSIISTVIALRHMSDFPIINKIYGSLFTQPNPPARVTISCGDLLPPDCNIAVYLSVHTGLAPGTRQGLHVQSRSYWAPANIGPYSQAVSIPLSSLSPAGSPSSSAAALVHVAGQIPLVPATMQLPDKSQGLELSAVLSLQHLWRIGAETGVQWWTSAVAYLPHESSVSSARDRALLASRVWRAAHAWSSSPPGDGGEGPDLWDRTHNPAYMSFSDEAASGPRPLPDRSVLVDAEDATPALFVAEVRELPRQAGVEWHAHLGVARLDDASVRVVGAESESEAVVVRHTVVTTSTADDDDDEGRGRGKRRFVHTVLAAKQVAAQTDKLPAAVVVGELATLYLAQMAGLVGLDAAREIGEVVPAHLYVHAGLVAVALGDVGRDGCPVIPCFSLWSAKGEEMVAVAVYQAWFD